MSESAIDGYIRAQLAAALAENARLTSELAQSTNYVADSFDFPKRITFANGRVVVIKTDEQGAFMDTWIELAAHHKELTAILADGEANQE